MYLSEASCIFTNITTANTLIMHRGALNLLSSYGGDSSDEEVPIGRVSTKRCLKELDEINSKRVQSRLPVPDMFLNPNSTNDNVPVDNPLLHGGRKRSFPHERGNWVTYIYIPYQSTDSIITDIITQVVDRLSFLKLEIVNDYHISLTKTVILKHHWIESFMESVRLKLQTIKKFVIIFNTLKVYCNEERTRTFIGLDIKSGYDTLCKIVENLDSCMDEFKLPHFYEKPSFHMSLMWCVGDYTTEISSVLPEICSSIEEIMNNNSSSSWYNYVSHLQCKCGNKLFNFNLS